MMRKGKTVCIWAAALGCLALGLAACGDDDKKADGNEDAGGQGGNGDQGSNGGQSNGNANDGNGTGNNGAVDAGNGGADDAGNGAQDSGTLDAGPGPFVVPAAGGTTTIMGASGVMVSFDFPASAAGVEVQLTLGSGSDIGWPATRFSDVIKMEPSGTKFSEPVKIKISDGSLLVLDFPSSATQSAPEALMLNAAGDALLLNHFSTLAVVAADQWCDSTSGWQDQDNSASCSGETGGKTTYRSFTCKAYSLCELIEANCCVTADDPDLDCRIGDAALVYTTKRTDSNGGQYPYCDAPSSCPFVPAAAGACYTNNDGACECGIDYMKPAGYVTYLVTCASGTCTCASQVGSDAKVSYGTAFSYAAACSTDAEKAALHQQWASHCCPVP